MKSKNYNILIYTHDKQTNNAAAVARNAIQLSNFQPPSAIKGRGLGMAKRLTSEDFQRFSKIARLLRQNGQKTPKNIPFFTTFNIYTHTSWSG